MWRHDKQIQGTEYSVQKLTIHLWSFVLQWRCDNEYSGERMVFSKIVLAQLIFIWKWMELHITSYSKINSRWIVDLNVKYQAIKRWEHKHIIFVTWGSQDFLNGRLNALTIFKRLVNWITLKLKNFCSKMISLKMWKGTYRVGEGIYLHICIHILINNLHLEYIIYSYKAL